MKLRIAGKKFYMLIELLKFQECGEIGRQFKRLISSYLGYI